MGTFIFGLMTNFLLDLFVHCEQLHKYGYMHTLYMNMWRPEINLGCHYTRAVHHGFEMMSHWDMGLPTRLAQQDSKPQGPFYLLLSAGIKVKCQKLGEVAQPLIPALRKMR